MTLDASPHVIVTGGSRGIGAGIATTLAGRGARVTVGYRTGEALARALVEQVEADGGEAVAVPVDVTERDHVEAMVATSVDRFGPLHGLVCNAGTLFGGRGVGEVDRRAWVDVVDVNVVGPHRCVVAAEPHLVEGALVVTTSSPAAFYGSPIGAHYSAGKAGVVALTRVLASRLGPRGVRVNCVVPGSFPSDLRATMASDHHDRVRAESALGRSAAAEEMGGVVAFLLSPAGRLVDGQVLFVDGGRFMLP